MQKSWAPALIHAEKDQIKHRENERRQTEGASKIRTVLKSFELTKNSHEVQLPRGPSEDMSELRVRVWQMSMRVIRCVYIVIHPWLHIEMCGFLESLEGVCVSPAGICYYSCLFMSLSSLPACATHTRARTRTQTAWLIVLLAWWQQ